jgi:uncharacterized protein YndB with AHSA1/START domain
MATNARTVSATRDAVWRALSDGNTYGHWVVGTSEIRAVDPQWPQRGSRLHYTVGRGPLRHEGHTEVLAVDDRRRLELKAHAWPAGSARIELILDDVGERCRVTMVEHPADGVVARLHNRLADLLLKLRNVVALRRLDRIAAQRQ